MIQNLVKLYEGESLAGANSGVVFLPILFNCTLTGIDVLTDENVVGDCVFSVAKNGALVTGSTLTVTNGTRLASSGVLSVALVKGDEVVLNMTSGSLNSPITLNLAVDDGITATVISSTDDLSEGSTNKYFTAARVWATFLTGIVFTTNAAITAGDSILAAFGKIQAQITALIASVSANTTAIGGKVTSNAAITGATKTKITYDAKGLVTNGADATATDVGLSNVTNDAQLKRAAGDFASFTAKATPISADLLLIEDSAASGAKKKIQIGDLPSSGGTSLPSQTGNTGKFLKTDGSALSWDTPSGGGGGSVDLTSLGLTVLGSDMSDDFTGASVDTTTKWNSTGSGSGAVSIASNQLSLASGTGAAEAYLRSKTTWDLRNKAVQLYLASTEAATGHSDPAFQFIITTSSSVGGLAVDNYALIQVYANDGMISFSVNGSTLASAAYNSTTDKYLRFEVSLDFKVFLKTSTDGTTWTTRASGKLRFSSLDCYIFIRRANFGSGGTSGAATLIDNFKIFAPNQTIVWDVDAGIFALRPGAFF